jgi:predicted Zn-dependent protease
LGRLALVVALTATCAACAVNPATGKRQFMLISEQQEQEIGRQNDQAIVADMGLYDDDDLQAYVQQLGRDLAARSERPHLEWTFRVVDDPVVNAFALPGGYIYITRGILAHVENEAELASVIGHEIGHVTARHGASQMSKAQLAGLGLGVGSILAPEESDRFSGIAQTTLALVFLKYGRDDERQADDLGLRYVVAGGYDPRRMADMFDMLDEIGSSAGAGKMPGWMSTHPTPGNRRSRSEAKIAAMNRDFTGWSVDRDEFLARIDGISFGEDPRQGYFKGRTFIHPDMRFSMEFPEGWKLQNHRSAVVGSSQEEDAMLQLAVADAASPEAALQAFFSRSGFRRTGPTMGSISGLRTAGDGFAIETEQGAIQGRVGYVSYGGLVFELVGYSAQHRWAHHEPSVRRALASFDRVTDARVLAVEAQRLELVRADRAMSLARFAERHGATAPVETLALINRLDPDATLESGRTYKIIRGGELP